MIGEPDRKRPSGPPMVLVEEMMGTVRDGSTVHAGNEIPRVRPLPPPRGEEGWMDSIDASRMRSETADRIHPWETTGPPFVGPVGRPFGDAEKTILPVYNHQPIRTSARHSRNAPSGLCRNLSPKAVSLPIPRTSPTTGGRTPTLSPVKIIPTAGAMPRRIRQVGRKSIPDW